MDENEWLASKDPAPMVRLLTGEDRPRDIGGNLLRWDDVPVQNVHASKVRLWVETCRQISHPGGTWPVLNDHAALVRDVLIWSFPDDHKRPNLAERADILRDLVGNPWWPMTFDRVCYLCRGKKTITLPDWPGIRTSFAPLLCNLCGRKGIVKDWPTWLTPTVKAIAVDIRNNLRWDLLPVLADCMEEAGCPQQETCNRCGGSGQVMIPGQYVRGVCGRCSGSKKTAYRLLEHLRSLSTHYCGCLALELVLSQN